MTRPKSESTESLLARLVSVHSGDESSSLAPFWDRLVAEGYTTSADDARRVLQMIGAYDDPRIPFTRGTPTRIGGIDTEQYTGFAFGLGLTRLAMMKYGIRDIRVLNSGDLRALVSPERLGGPIVAQQESCAAATPKG